MTEHTIKLPDVGEGIAEAEITEILVAPGDTVREDQVLAAVMTDKATVEIPSPVAGTVKWVGIEVGKTVAIGSKIFIIEADDALSPSKAAPSPEKKEPVAPAPAFAAEERETQRPAKEPAPAVKPAPAPKVAAVEAAQRPSSSPLHKPLAAPSVRQRARELGLALSSIKGTGPGGRILHEDVEQAAKNPAGLSASHHRGPNTRVDEIQVIGLRRKIAQRMQDTKRRIPHFSYIEEVDVTSLEDLRADINGEKRAERPKLTLLPFIISALVIALRDFPDLNARYDDEKDVLHRYGGVHVGIATQTPNGLMVPVIRHAETLDMWECAREIARLADEARRGSIKREELTGSTITITSLGALGGLATTPVINSPEVSIIGINKIATRPVWRNGHVEPRKIMNLSSSFDHRIVDGWVAAEFIQKLRALLEMPSRILIEV
jgi:2-oxoisovalerate dehydrogenase E2 component (dihydrolipoyl transacylase)